MRGIVSKRYINHKVRVRASGTLMLTEQYLPPASNITHMRFLRATASWLLEMHGKLHVLSLFDFLHVVPMGLSSDKKRTGYESPLRTWAQGSLDD